MGLSTHVLDTARGVPAAGMRIVLLRLSPTGAADVLKEVRTNADGRVEGGLLDAAALRVGRYALRFAVAEYFRAAGIHLPEPPFLDQVTVEFGIADPAQHYHVPLLVSPYGYTTYRGS